ncbi:phosphoribosylformylglycinamidine synthase subunit PurQ [Candidatus Peregrinibacteria bacterium]|nr:phosphoribosylformylglycinamidine synthase subunit PurQ [Candidatus Peregrinibacteria bacterium]
MIRFAVLFFPGSKPESETVRAFSRSGMEAEQFPWNDPLLLEEGRLEDFDGYCLVGKWNGERGDRLGAIAARDPVMETIKKEASKGKVVLGIGRGAEILAESGLIPGYDSLELACAVVWTGMPQEGRGAEAGIRDRGIHLKSIAPKNRSAFNSVAGLLELPFGHGEGQFVFGNPATLKALRGNGQILFQYCDERGKAKASAPLLPGGSNEAIAALCNPAGNVMAIISHPGRDPLGGGDAIFASIREWIGGKVKVAHNRLGKLQIPEDIRPFEPADLEFLVRPKKPDPLERSMEAVLGKAGFKVALTRYDYWSVKLFLGMDPKGMALQILRSGVIADVGSQWVTTRIGKEVYSYSPEKGLQPIEMSPERWLVVRERFDSVGEWKAEEVRKQVRKEVESVGYGVLWDVEKADEKALYGIIRTKILYNPNSMYIMKH